MKDPLSPAARELHTKCANIVYNLTRAEEGDRRYDPYYQNARAAAIRERNEALKKLQEEEIMAKGNGNWYPANGGTEVPFVTRTRRRLLYVWQPSTGNHAYLDCDTDIILTDEEARLALATH